MTEMEKEYKEIIKGCAIDDWPVQAIDDWLGPAIARERTRAQIEIIQGLPKLDMRGKWFVNMDELFKLIDRLKAELKDKKQI